jgi:lysozyme
MTWCEYAEKQIKGYEGCELHAYPDPATGGAPWTIGYGATGPGITKGTVWTQEQADMDLRARVVSLGAFVDSIVKIVITDEQKAALISFAYNVGKGALKGSTLLRKLNAGDVEGAANEFLRWNKAAGKVMAGLTKRRDGERALFLLGSSFEKAAA